jgi:hypothetical protein
MGPKIINRSPTLPKSGEAKRERKKRKKKLKLKIIKDLEVSIWQEGKGRCIHHF